MAEIVNLRVARKRRDRAARADEAAENRARFGQPRTAVKLREALRDRDIRELEGHRISAAPAPAQTTEPRD